MWSNPIKCERGKENALDYVYIGNAGQDNITKCSKCAEQLIYRKNFKTISKNLNEDRCPNCDKRLEGVF